MRTQRILAVVCGLAGLAFGCDKPAAIDCTGPITSLRPLKAGGWLAALKDYKVGLDPAPRTFIITDAAAVQPVSCP